MTKEQAFGLLENIDEGSYSQADMDAVNPVQYGKFVKYRILIEQTKE